MTVSGIRAVPETDDEAWYYFVHGTATLLWGTATAIDPSAGGGEFGIGAYTFRDTRWGRLVAWQWAHRKAQVGGLPILVRVKIERLAYDSLDREDISDEALIDAYQMYAPDRSTGNELVVGSVSKRGAVGRIADKSMPDQYKFEGVGIAKLIVDSIIPASYS